MKNTNLKRVLSLILSISIFLFCNMGNIKVKAKEIQSAENIQEKTAVWEQEVVDFAMSLLGKPYKENGSTPEGFDLCGFTKYVYSNSVGINIGNKIYMQENEGISVNYENIKLGDLVFTKDNSGAEIVGIYVGNAEYIYASEKGVIIEKISNFKCATRIIYDEERQVLKVNKGETYEIKNTLDENIYLLTDNINANVDAQNYSVITGIEMLSNNEWTRIEKGYIVKFTVLE